MKIYVKLSTRHFHISNSNISSRQLQLPFLLAFNYGLYKVVSLFQNNGFKQCSVVLCKIMMNRNI